MKVNHQNNICIFQNAAELARSTAELMIAISKQAIKSRGKFILSLSGGHTPEYLYKLLAEPPYRDQIPWEKTYIFWGDERLVPSDNSQNNAHMAKTLLLDHLNIPPNNIHPIPVDIEPVESAERYTNDILEFFENNPPRFDLIILGLGKDGHTASLFPGSDAVFEKKSIMRAVYSAEQQMFRITMTPPIINKAYNIVFLVSGEDKAQILKNVIDAPRQPDKLPAQIVNAENGNLYWYVDKSAAKLLSTQIITGQ